MKKKKKIILSSMYNPSVAYILGYYREEFLRVDLKCWQVVLNPRSLEPFKV